MSCSRSASVRCISSWLSAITWSEMSRSRSPKRRAKRSFAPIVSSGMPVVPVHFVVSSAAPDDSFAG